MQEVIATKDIVGVTLLFIAVPVCVLLFTFSIRLREAAFFFMIAAVVISERLDINFFSRYWYRGSTRGVEISFVDVIALAVLISSFLLPRAGYTRWRWPAGLGIMLIFTLYAFGVTATVEPRIFGLFELSKMLRGLVFFVAAVMMVRSDRELALCVLAICCATYMEGVLVVKQRWLDHMDRVAGSLDHANSLSMWLCLVGPIFVAAINSNLHRVVRWCSGAALAVAAFSIVLTASRAGVPIFLFVVLGSMALCITWKMTLQKVIVTGFAVTAIAVLGPKLWGHLRERYDGSSLSEEYLADNIIDSRGYYLRLARLMIEERFFGVGLNNWSYAVSKKYGKELNTPYSDYDAIPADLNYDEDLNMNFAAPAHNLSALTVGELGVPGLVLFLLMWLRWFQMGSVFLWRRERSTLRLLGTGLFFGMLGVFLQSLTEWIFRQTAIYLTFHALLGVMATLYMIQRKMPARVNRPVPVPVAALKPVATLAT